MDKVDELLISTCKTMIRTILACIDHATKGTIYRIGLMPELRATRVMSGIRKPGTDEIEWGLPANSDYNAPGKKWAQYRDAPGRPLEAMGWCVEKQMSWTAENPLEDARSVRKQLVGEPEDFYHMEPVLVKKRSLYGTAVDKLQYASDYRGNPIWQDTDCVVAAVIKIHFKPNTLKRGDRSTQIIHELSRTLGSELLSIWYREILSRARKDFARQRLQSCEILAHELRNTLVKLGFVFSAINAQISILRESWESFLREKLPGLEWKGEVLGKLSSTLSEKLPGVDLPAELSDLCQSLLYEQKELARLSLSPRQEQDWVQSKINPKWEKLLARTALWDKDEINALLAKLHGALQTGMNLGPDRKVDGLPEELVEQWSKLAYIQITSGNLFQLDEIIRLVEHPALPVCHKEQILRVLKSLKALVFTIPEVEEKATRILQSLRYGTWAEDQFRFDAGMLDLDYQGEFEVALTD